MNTTSINKGVYIVTENADGILYVINCLLRDLETDWNGDCNFVPANDARVFFAAIDGEPVNPYLYTNFESLLQLLIERAYHDAEKKESETDDPKCFGADPEWITFREKWGYGDIDRSEMSVQNEIAFVEDLYDVYEKTGFVPFFQARDSEYQNRNGKRFTVLGRISTDDPKWDLECLPAWHIRFEDGSETCAFPEEICFSEIFPLASSRLIPYLDALLEDNDSETGGIAFEGETVMDFMLDCVDENLNSVEDLNIFLKECGINPVTTTPV